MTEGFEEIRQIVASMLSDATASIIAFTPRLIGALLVLLVGWLLARLIRSLVERSIRASLDTLLERTGVAQALERTEMTLAPSAIVARVLYWLIMTLVVMAASEIVGLTAVTGAITRILAYIPSVITAALVLAAGILLARFVGNLVRSAGEAAGLTYAQGLGVVARGSVVVMVGVVTVEELGIDTQIIVTVITVTVAAIALGMGAAFAVGAGPVFRGILAGHYLRQTLPEGSPIEVAGARGVVESIGPLATVLRDGDQTWSVPNARLVSEIVKT